MASKTQRTDAIEEDDRLPLGESARYVGRNLSPHTMRSWARQGKIPYFKVGRRLFFAKSDLDAFLRRSRIEAR